MEVFFDDSREGSLCLPLPTIRSVLFIYFHFRFHLYLLLSYRFFSHGLILPFHIKVEKNNLTTEGGTDGTQLPACSTSL